jgi:hypothetical protein
MPKFGSPKNPFREKRRQPATAMAGGSLAPQGASQAASTAQAEMLSSPLTPVAATPQDLTKSATPKVQNGPGVARLGTCGNTKHQPPSSKEGENETVAAGGQGGVASAGCLEGMPPSSPRPSTLDPRWLGLGRIKGFWSWLVPPRIGRVRPRLARPENAPVQGELSLDRVKVVRNDLSDVELEVVPGRAAATGAGPATGGTRLSRAATQLLSASKG